MPINFLADLLYFVGSGVFFASVAGVLISGGLWAFRPRSRNRVEVRIRRSYLYFLVLFVVLPIVGDWLTGSASITNTRRFLVDALGMVLVWQVAAYLLAGSRRALRWGSVKWGMREKV